jgi:hypothetical protein
MTEEEKKEDKQEGEKENEKTILDKEKESWNNYFGYALREEATLPLKTYIFRLFSSSPIIHV